MRLNIIPHSKSVSQVSISSTFFARFFCTNVFSAAFFLRMYVRKYVNTYVCKYNKAAEKTLAQKIRASNVDEIDGRR